MPPAGAGRGEPVRVEGQRPWAIGEVKGCTHRPVRGGKLAAGPSPYGVATANFRAFCNGERKARVAVGSGPVRPRRPWVG